MISNIDIVIPWVDGSDEEWLAEKGKYRPGTGTDDNVNRYRDWGLLPYWFRGVEKYAPWIRKIHFITWGHVPGWLNTGNPKLNIVKHSDYIPGKYLPVFSSHPIELNMHRINDLSDQFVYFNDDVFLTGYCSPEDFFKNGKPVDNVTEVPLRFNEGGIDHIIGNNMAVINKHFNKKETVKKNKNIWFSFKAPKAALKNLYMLPVNGFSAFENPHLPQPFLKSTLTDVWNAENELIDETCSHKFRNNEDVNQWVFRYWQFAKGNIIQSGKERGKFFSIGKDDNEIQDAILNSKYKTVCLSDDDISYDFQKEQVFLQELFEKKLPEKSSFEK